MDSGKKLVRVAPCRSSDTQVAVMVASTHHTRFVRHTETISAVVAPEGFRTNMTARFTFRPFQIAVGEKLPRMAVVHFMFVSKRYVHAVLIQQSHSKREAAAVTLRTCIHEDAHAGKHQYYRLFHRHSSSNKAVLNESADSTSS